MAILERVFADEERAVLGSLLSGSIRIFRSASTNRLAVEDAKSNRVAFKVDYEGVEFKFECFFLRMLDSQSREARESTTKIALVECESVAAVQRVEWTRSAVLGEVPHDHEQVVQRRGRLSKRPSNYWSTCVATVGLLFIRHGIKVGLLAISDDDPLALVFTADDGEIATYLAECDVGEEVSLRSP